MSHETETPNHRSEIEDRRRAAVRETSGKIRKKPEMKDYPVHPVAAFFPMMEDVEIADLAADIKANGQANPIMIATIDGETVLIDGRNRLAACRLVGVSPWFEDVPEHAMDRLTDFILSLNIKRRNLTPSQKAAIAIQSLEFQRIDAKRRQQKSNEFQLGKTLPNRESAGKSIELAAKSTGANPEYVRQAEKIQKTSPEKFAEVAAGKKTIHKATQELKAEQASAFPASETHITAGAPADEDRDNIADVGTSEDDSDESRDGNGQESDAVAMAKSTFLAKQEADRKHKQAVDALDDSEMVVFMAWKKQAQPF